MGKNGSPGPAAARRNASRKNRKKAPLRQHGRKAKSSRFYRNNRYFFCSMGKTLFKSEFKKFSIFFPERGEKRSQVGIQRNFDLFPEHGKNSIQVGIQRKSEKLQIFSEASAADPRIKLCPRLAGLGPRRDYSIRPASACRWARPVRRDTGECARNKPACAAGRLC